MSANAFSPASSSSRLAAPSPVLTVYAEPWRLSAAALAQAASSACAQSIARALQTQARASPLDARVQRALDEVDVLLSGKVRADAVAEAAHLSLSQLERLFIAQRQQQQGRQDPQAGMAIADQPGGKPDRTGPEHGAV